MSLVKALLHPIPLGRNMLGEIDVPFPLPSDFHFIKNLKRVKHKQRREIFDQLAYAFEGYKDLLTCKKYKELVT